jgi:hypothetical protein
VDIWEAIGFLVIVWWCVSTIMRNNRWFRAMRLQGRNVKPDFGFLFRLMLLPVSIRNSEKKWIRETLEQEKYRKSAT